jgi:hypothetical protein
MRMDNSFVYHQAPEYLIFRQLELICSGILPIPV